MKRFTQKPILLGLATLCILLSGCNQDEIDSLTTERDNLQTQVNTLTSEKQAAETKASNAEGQVSTIQNQLTQAQNELKELKATNKADKDKIATLEGKNGDLQKQLNTVQVGLDKANADSVDGLIDQITNLQSQVKNLESQVQTLKLASYSFEANATVVLDASSGSEKLPDQLKSPRNNRGFSATSTHVYVTDNSAGTVWAWEIGGSGEAIQLKGTDIAGGAFGLKLIDVVATNNGIIASNLGWRGNGLKIYRWKNHDEDPELLIEHDAIITNEEDRFGDAITFTGEANGDGHLFIGNTSSNNVLKYNFEDGVVVNGDDPEIITFEGLTKGSYPHVKHVTHDHDENQYLLVNNAENPPNLYSTDGTKKLTNVTGGAIDKRVASGEIFHFYEKTYLALATAGPEGSVSREAAVWVYDISGDDLVTAFNSIGPDKLVYKKVFGSTLNNDQGADVDVYVDPDGEFIHLFAGAINNGFVVIKVTK